jgi:hypothetical protein
MALIAKNERDPSNRDWKKCFHFSRRFIAENAVLDKIMQKTEQKEKGCRDRFKSLTAFKESQMETCQIRVIFF